MNDLQCEGTVATHLVLTIGLTIIWIIQLRFALRATLLAHKALPLAQILSTYDGYKAFLRFLTGELSIENLEFFQLSMRWRFRLCCWLHGVENGTKPPADNIKIPFEIFSFQYVDRLLPQTEGGGLVLNEQEIQQQQQLAITIQNKLNNHNQNNGNKKDLPALSNKDSTQFFQSLPLSRAASINSPNPSNHPSRTSTPHFGAMVGPFGGPSVINFQLSSGDLGIPQSGVVTAPSSFNRLPPTILEGNDEEEQVDNFDGLDTTRTNTATYMLPMQMQQNSYDDDGTGTGVEYSHSSLLQHNKHSQRQLIDVIVNRNGHHNPQNTMIVNEHITDHNDEENDINNGNKQPIHQQQIKHKKSSIDDANTENGSQTQTPNARPALSPLSPANIEDGIMQGPTPMEEEVNEHQYALKKIPKEDEIDAVEYSTQSSMKSTGTGIITSTTMAALQRMYDDITEQSDVDTIPSDQLSPRRNPKIEKFVPSMINTTMLKHPSTGSQDTDLQQHLTPIHVKQAVDITRLNPRSYTEPETPLTPEPDTVTLPEVPSALPPQSDDEQGINLSDGSNTKQKHSQIGNRKQNSNQSRDRLPLPLNAFSSADSDDAGMEYIDYDSKHDGADITATPNKTPMTMSASITSQRTEKKMVRFANTFSKDDKDKEKLSKVGQLQFIDHDTPNGSPKYKPVAMPSSKKKKLTMHDLLGGHTGVGAGATTSNAVNNVNDGQTSEVGMISSKQSSFREDSVASKAEPSWFAAWFRKGNVVGGQQERADTLLHYSDLSWRRLKKVSKEVNMSAMARESVNALFKKYPKSRYLESRGISIEEYDEAMRDAWISTWENMNDSLRRFAKSAHYESYLSTAATTIRRLTDDDRMDINVVNDGGANNGGIAIRGSASAINVDGNNQQKTLKFRIGSISKKKDKNVNNQNYNNEQRQHSRTSPITY